MSSPSSPPPAAAPRPRPPRPGPPPGRPGKAPGWGWLEWTVLAQTLIPALLFVPGLSAIRALTRVGVFAVVLVAWAAVALTGRRFAAGRFPARPWLLFCAGYLILSILNPTTNSLAAGVAEVALVAAVFSPAFWAGRVLAARVQVPRILAILFLSNALSAGFGVGQVYRPSIFNPPLINVVNSDYGIDSVSFENAAGQKIVRPCGLTDTPGAASSAGAFAAIAGLCWALRPMATWKRLASLALACVGVAAIYLTQVRMMLVVTGICVIGLIVILAAQRDFKRAALLGFCAAAVLVGAFTWAVTAGGEAVQKRFSTLLEKDAYGQSRGGFLRETFEHDLPTYPLGAGLGRWGTIYLYFGDKAAPIERQAMWVEIQFTAWIFDGGVPLMVAYLGAALVAVGDSLRIALRSRDRDLAYWGGVVAAINLGTVATCFSYPVFNSAIGIQFWLLAAAVHAADRRGSLAGAVAGRPGPRPGPGPGPGPGVGAGPPRPAVA